MQPDSRDRKPLGLADVLCVACLYLALLLLAQPGVAWVDSTLLAGQIKTRLGEVTLAVLAGIACNVIACFYTVYLVSLRTGSAAVLGLRRGEGAREVALALVAYARVLPAIFLAAFVVRAVSLSLGRETGLQMLVTVVMEEQRPAVIALIVLFGISIAPITEEIMFRGFLQTALREVLPSRGAILASAFVFALAHGNAYALLPILVLGLLLGHLFEKRRALAAPIIVHAAHNALMMGLLLGYKYGVQEVAFLP